MRLLLIRHAETRGNTQHRMLGQLDELLSPHGVLQAQLLGQFFIPAKLATDASLQ